MTKHLADHHISSDAERLTHFIRIARDRSQSAWHAVWRRQVTGSDEGRRVVEYLRIERGRLV